MHRLIALLVAAYGLYALGTAHQVVVATANHGIDLSTQLQHVSLIERAVLQPAIFTGDLAPIRDRLYALVEFEPKA